jgi:predicted metal-dependent HD superfamily phosphohydrolase
MTDSPSSLLAAARDYATDILLNKISKNVSYHNLEHTKRVVAACEEMAEYYQLQPDDKEALLIGAWFHDTGFSAGKSLGHEEVSKQLATDFLEQHKASPSLVAKINGCIDATKMPQSPNSLIEQIICDADLFHLGTDEFNVKNEELRQELKGFSGEELSKKKWRKMNIAFMENHKYFTDYGKRKLQPVKDQYIGELKGSDAGVDTKKDSKKDKNKKGGGELLAALTDEVKKDGDTGKKKDKENQTERGISTVFRIMANNHVSLSQMADSKANIMISVNSIILSVVISVLLRRLEEDTHLIIPTTILVLVCVATIVFAVKATRPNVSEGTFTKEDIQNKKTNLLFFGNFHNMSLPDYDWAMKEMLNSRDYLYSSMVKDLYFLGVVLAKKYAWLRISYNIFMYGLIITMLTYGAAILYEAYFVTTTQVVSSPVAP